MSTCAAGNCNNTDKMKTCYKFPKDRKLAQKWVDNLILQDFPLEIIQNTFVVCEDHFGFDDFEHETKRGKENASPDGGTKPKLKSNAIPKLYRFERGNSCPSKQNDMIRSYMTESFVKSISLPPLGLPNLPVFESPFDPKPPPIIKTPLNEQSTISNQSDVIILDESHYSNSTTRAHTPIGSSLILGPIGKLPSTTTEITYNRRTSATGDESTDVLILKSSDSEATTTNSMQQKMTDSDVEVLNTEDIVESDWSADGGLVSIEYHKNKNNELCTVVREQSADFEEIMREELCEVDRQLKAKKKEVGKSKVDDCADAMLSLSVNESHNKKTQRVQRHSDSTDISLEEFSRSSTSAAIDASSFREMTSTQLLNVIHSQSIRIYKLEEALKRHRSAEQELFDHVDELRRELAASSMVLEENNMESNSKLINKKGEDKRDV